MSKELTAAAGHVVLFKYTLTDGEGVELDASGDESFAALLGAENIVDGLENEMLGKGVGDSFKAVVLPEDGYGLHDGNIPQAVPRSDLPKDMEVHVGMVLGVRTPDNKEVAVWVVDLNDKEILIDHNHPLAGKTLHFDVEITGLRDASDEEKAHGHPHGEGGHHHH